MHTNLCAHILLPLVRLVDTRPRDLALDVKMAAKSLRLYVDLRSSRKNYSVQVFKTMQGVHGFIGSFDAFVAYCCGIFVSASFVFTTA